MKKIIIIIIIIIKQLIKIFDDNMKTLLSQKEKPLWSNQPKKSI
jgi:hypothetical protein